MNATRVLVLIYTCLVALAIAGKTYFPDCRAQPSEYCQRENCNVWYVDPVAGTADGDGSAAKPWNAITLAVAQIRAKKVSSLYTGPVPIPESALKDLNPDGTIVGGDVIVLRSGTYTNIDIRNIYVTVPITIMGEPGGRPLVDHFVLLGTSNFIVACLNFTTSTPGPSDTIVTLSSINYLGPSYNNIFTKNTIFSYPDLDFFKGKPQEYLFNASSAAFLTRDALYTEVSRNYLYNIKRGFVGMSAYTAYSHNVINYFIGDGFRVLHNNTIVEHNLVMNSMNVDNNQDHRDGVQFFTNGNKFNLADIIIRNNVFIADEDKTRPHLSGFQGISGFDVRLYNVTVENNLVTTIWNWHGISLWKSDNCKIIGNTVLDVSGNTTFYPWISTTNGTYGNIVQNNIAHALVELHGVENLNSNVIKRWTMRELQDLFVDPFNFNLRLKDNGSNPFIGAGNATNAPTVDNDGNIRGGAYDVGCFAFHPLDPNTNSPTTGNPNSGNPASPATGSPSSGPAFTSRGVSAMTGVSGFVTILFAFIATLTIC